MVNHAELHKIFSALITPMDSSENVNYSALTQLVQAQLDDGVEGFYCCGSSGEGLLLSLEERKKVLECTIKAADGKVPVVSHIGTIRTADVVELAKHAQSTGAAAVSMIPPYYYKFSMSEIIEYYETVIRQVSGIPVIIYNIPQFTGVEFSKLNADKLFCNPGVIGIKHTSNNLYSMERMHTEYPDKVIFNGFDEQFIGALAMGAQATIGTTVNLFAPMFLRLRDFFAANKMAEAYQLQCEINQRVEAMVSVGIFSAVKYGWKRRGIDCGVCRAPFAQLSEQQKQYLNEILG